MIDLNTAKTGDPVVAAVEGTTFSGVIREFKTACDGAVLIGVKLNDFSTGHDLNGLLGEDVHSGWYFARTDLTTIGGGNKDDSSKPRYDLIPPEALAALADVLTYGAKKYGDRNWEKGIGAERLFAAAQRHLWAWWEAFNESRSRSEQDEESGLSHLDHAYACIAFLITLDEREHL